MTPLDKNMDSKKALSDFSTPIVSVIVPMRDHRGIAIEAVESWVKKQRCNPDDFEVILIIDDTTRQLEGAFRRMLRPHDQLIIHMADSYMEQYDVGARYAKGEFLFFAEPHCIAEPEAISEMLYYISSRSYDGFCARTTPICTNSIAQTFSRIFEERFEEWSREDHWSKVFMRGFGIRRSVYIGVGGFLYKYKRFAESLLAATLHAGDIALVMLQAWNSPSLRKYLRVARFRN